VGLAAGVGAALLLSRYAESLLFEVQAHDVWTYTGACLVLMVAAVLCVDSCRLAARPASILS
jgi:hypothetical protein